eukprot:TRINITY_DN11519_c0_g1_i1.p4 TRINITY_DN11519_c0_g1~~TRINITY_DN11519_c0_g1_i1.p4  ORF type:complete len:106 (+),score=4.19 TRINITY_DN11519_c0_g1_i1:1752-2069(+)
MNAAAVHSWHQTAREEILMCCVEGPCIQARVLDRLLHSITPAEEVPAKTISSGVAHLIYMRQHPLWRVPLCTPRRHQRSALQLAPLAPTLCTHLRLCSSECKRRE